MPRYPDGKGGEVAMHEKVNDVDKAKQSLSPKHIGPCGKVSSFFCRKSILTTDRRLVRYGICMGNGRLASTLYPNAGLWDSGESKPAAWAWRDGRPGGDQRHQRRDHNIWSLGPVR